MRALPTALIATVIALAAGAAEPPRYRVQPLPSMSAQRAAHSATLLRDGTVLLIGGCSSNSCEGYGATSERFDPKTGRFTPSGTMAVGRSSHTAVPLPDGRVLVTGGWTRNGVTASAEVYDPATGRFSPAGQMTTPRSDHAAVMLPNNRILFIGGEQATQEGLASVEFYDPRDRAFHAAGTLTVPRLSHAVFLQPEGRVLVVGGRSGRGQILDSTELYDPATGRSTPTGKLRVPRHKFGATMFPDWRVIVVGGSDRDESGARYTSTEIYDPASGVWVAGPELTHPRYKLEGGVVALKDGRLLVAGGADVAELLDLTTGRSEVLAGATTGAHAFATATKLEDDRVLLAGGYDARLRVTAAAWIIAPE